MYTFCIPGRYPEKLSKITPNGPTNCLKYPLQLKTKEDRGEGGTQNEGCLEGASSGGRGEGWGVALLGGSRAMPGCACGDSKHGRVCNGLFVTQGLRAWTSSFLKWHAADFVSLWSFRYIGRNHWFKINRMRNVFATQFSKNADNEWNAKVNQPPPYTQTTF